MAEYIDRHQIRYTWWQKQDGTFTDGVTLQSVIDLIPTADVVEVVRCKDCIHYKLRNVTSTYSPKKPCCLRSAAVTVKEDDYCSFGIKKEGETDD